MDFSISIGIDCVISHKILALDYGSKFMGLAFWEGHWKQDISLEKWKNQDETRFLQRLSLYLEKKNISFLIVGYPLSEHYEKNTRTQEVENFVKKLQKTLQIPNIHIYLQSERFSTRYAYEIFQTLRHKGKGDFSQWKDALAAYIILKDFVKDNYERVVQKISQRENSMGSYLKKKFDSDIQDANK